MMPPKFGASSSRNKSASNITAIITPKFRFEGDDEFSVSVLFVTFFYFTWGDGRHLNGIISHCRYWIRTNILFIITVVLWKLIKIRPAWAVDHCSNIIICQQFWKSQTSERYWENTIFYNLVAYGLKVKQLPWNKTIKCKFNAAYSFMGRQ